MSSLVPIYQFNADILEGTAAGPVGRDLAVKGVELLHCPFRSNPVTPGLLPLGEPGLVTWSTSLEVRKTAKSSAP